MKIETRLENLGGSYQWYSLTVDDRKVATIHYDDVSGSYYTRLLIGLKYQQSYLRKMTYPSRQACQDDVIDLLIRWRLIS